MRKNKRVVLNGEEFTIITPKVSNSKEFDRLMTADIRTLSDCYGRCSQRKKNVWAFWKYWFASLYGSDNIGVTFKQFNGICSYNVNIFTLHGLITLWGVDYIVYITPTRKELIKVVE